MGRKSSQFSVKDPWRNKRPWIPPTVARIIEEVRYKNELLREQSTVMAHGFFDATRVLLNRVLVRNKRSQHRRTRGGFPDQRNDTCC